MPHMRFHVALAIALVLAAAPHVQAQAVTKAKSMLRFETGVCRVDFVSGDRSHLRKPVDFQWIFIRTELAADSQPSSGMKGILGISAAVALVLVQLAGLAAWRAEPAIYLTPIDGPVVTDDRRA